MLKERFFDLISKYCDDPTFNTRCWEEITKCYTAKNRYYHNLQHLENMLQELEMVKQEVKHMDSLLFSIYYHDIVYQATRSDNEHQSALLFKQQISPTNFNNIEYCFLQIEATKAHERSEDYDTNILLDLDLSILGKSQAIYKKYCQQIRQEYRIYPNMLYRRGRKRVLAKMLEHSSIYKTTTFIEKYEKQARANIALELNQL